MEALKKITRKISWCQLPKEPCSLVFMFVTRSSPAGHSSCELAVWLTVTLNSRSSCLHIPNAGSEACVPVHPLLTQFSLGTAVVLRTTVPQHRLAWPHCWRLRLQGGGCRLFLQNCSLVSCSMKGTGTVEHVKQCCIKTQTR